MTNYADETKMGKNCMQCTTGISDSKEINMLIHFLEIITKTGRYFPILFLSLASLNVLLATNDFLANSIEFGILNSLFATSGFIFLVQMRHNNKLQPLELTCNEIIPSSFSDTKEELRQHG